MKKLVLTIAMLVALSTSASAFDLGGYTGPLELKFTGNSVTDDPSFHSGAFGGETWAIFRLTSIEAPGVLLPLWTPTASERIYGFIYGLTDLHATAKVGAEQINQTGGVFSMHRVTGPIGVEYVRDTVNRTAFDTFETITDIGTPFLTGVLSPGVDPLDPLATIVQNFNWGTGEGDGAGFGEVTGGEFASLFDTNGIADFGGVFHDLEFDFQTDATPPAGLPSSTGRAEWFAQIDDPIHANVVSAVPEPASMVLFGTGLLGAAVRRKFFG